MSKFSEIKRKPNSGVKQLLGILTLALIRHELVLSEAEVSFGFSHSMVDNLKKISF